MSGDTFYTVTDQEDGKRQDATGRVTILPRKADQGKKHVCYVHNPATINPLWVKTYLEVLCKYTVHIPATINPQWVKTYLEVLCKYFMCTTLLPSTPSGSKPTWRCCVSILCAQPCYHEPSVWYRVCTEYAKTCFHGQFSILILI